MRLTLLLLSLLLSFACATARPPASPASILDRYYKADEPGAIVLAVRDGHVVMREGRGLADLELGTPLRTDMVMKLGSITKQFTAAAILTLADEGKLSLQDPLSQYVSGFDDAVKLEHLLTHTAGVAEYTPMPEYRAALRQDAAVEEIVALIRSKPLEFVPGAQFKYTNSAYYLLGAVVEKASGQPYASYLQNAVLKPAGLTQTRLDSLTEIIPNRAKGYDRDANGIRNATIYSPTRAYSVGGLLSTLDDLRRWNEHAVANPRLQAAFTRQPSGYGYGWFINELEGAKVIEHGGDIPGFSAHVLTIPDRRIFVAVLSNDAQHTPRPDFVATKIALSLLGKPYEPVAIALPAEALDAFTGIYKNAAGTKRQVTREGTKLFIERTGGRRSEIVPMSADTFFYPDTFMSVQFAREGEAMVMVLRNREVEVDRATR